MKEMWQKFKEWCDSVDTILFRELGFNGGVSEKQLDEAQQELGIVLPNDFRHCWQIHNGQKEWYHHGWIIDGMGLLPIEHIKKRWLEEKRLAEKYGYEPEGEPQDEGRILDVVFHPKRIPIAEHEGACELWLDFAPGPRGTPGQIIFNITECDFYVVGKDWSHFFSRYLKLLEEKKVICERHDKEWCFFSPDLLALQEAAPAYFKSHEELFGWIG